MSSRTDIFGQGYQAGLPPIPSLPDGQPDPVLCHNINHPQQRALARLLFLFFVLLSMQLDFLLLSFFSTMKLLSVSTGASVRLFLSFSYLLLYLTPSRNSASLSLRGARPEGACMTRLKGKLGRHGLRQSLPCPARQSKPVRVHSQCDKLYKI